MPQKHKIIFFGTSEFSVIVLNRLKELELVPDAVVTTLDKPHGRKMILTAPPAKVWAGENAIPVYQFEKLKEAQLPFSAGLFIVASYGKIIPQSLLDQAKLGALNIHPSILPEYRGPSPLQTAIIDDSINNGRDIGVTIIKIDSEMDHGPIVAMKKVEIAPDAWPPAIHDFEKIMAIEGANLLFEILPKWFDLTIDTAGKITEQDHSKATFTKMIKKSDGEINLSDDPWKNYLKIQALAGWPGTYFFVERQKSHADEAHKKIRVSIKSASFDRENKILIIERVTPEGHKEMTYADFLRGV